MSVDGRRKWKGKPEARAAVYANRRRIDPVDKPREDVGHVLGPGFPAIMHQGLLRRLLSGSLPGGDGRLPFFDRIDDYELHNGGRFGVRDSRVNLQVLTGVLLGILALEQPGGRGPRRRSRNFDDLLERLLVVPVVVSTDDSWIFLRWWARKSASAFFSLSTKSRNRPDLAAWPCNFHL